MIMGMRRSLAMSARRARAKRGFTLTEIAIVLGIVGLILGAIWVAAAAVYNNLKVSKGTTELLTIVQNVRAMYATSSQVDAAADMPAAFGAATASGANATYLAAGVFPADMLVIAATGVGATPQTATAAQNPWGGYVSIQSETTTVTGDSFGVFFNSVPSNACIGLLTANTGNGRDPDMQKAGAGAAGAYPAGSVPPILADKATLACTAATDAVGFIFLLK